MRKEKEKQKNMGIIMTTFEITIIVLLAAIVVLLIVLLRIAIKGFHCVWQKQDTILSDTMVLKAYFNNLLERFDNISRQLDNIEDNILDNSKGIPALVDIVDKMHRNLCVEIADKMVNRIYPDKESMNKIDWDKLSKEQQDEFLKRLIMPNYDSPFQPIYPPCYATNGICTNPQRDCINCPKIGTGGTWSTTLKAEGEMFQEKFNDSKED